MKKYIFILLLFCSNQLIAQNSFTIKGTFKDYNGVIYLKYNNKIDSSFVKNGLFSYTGNIDYPIRATLYIKDNRPVHQDVFTLEPGELTVLVDTTTKEYDGEPICKVNTSILKGGNTNALLESFYNNIESARSKMANMSVSEKRQFYIQFYSEALRKFIKQYPKEPASLILVEQTSIVLSQQELVSFYVNLDVRAKNSFYGQNLKTAIEKGNKAVVGMPIKDFAQTDINGNPISIRSLRGQVVLIEFWASWCGPCRENNPELIKIYQKYKSKGFEILAVSLDDNAESWLRAVEQDKLSWLHVSDLKRSENEVAIMLGVSAIPDNILIDREGKIIAKKINTSKELEQILNNVL